MIAESLRVIGTYWDLLRILRDHHPFDEDLCGLTAKSEGFERILPGLTTISRDFGILGILQGFLRIFLGLDKDFGHMEDLKGSFCAV